MTCRRRSRRGIADTANAPGITDSVLARSVAEAIQGGTRSTLQRMSARGSTGWWRRMRQAIGEADAYLKDDATGSELVTRRDFLALAAAAPAVSRTRFQSPEGAPPGARFWPGVPRS